MDDNSAQLSGSSEGTPRFSKRTIVILAVVAFLVILVPLMLFLQRLQNVSTPNVPTSSTNPSESSPGSQPGSLKLPNQIPNGSVVPSVSDPSMADWDTFASPKYGFAIRYPKDIPIEESSFLGSKGKEEIETLLTIDDGSLTISPNLPVKTVSSGLNPPTKVKEITIAGKQVTKYYLGQHHGIIRGVTSPRGDDIYIIFTLSIDPVKAQRQDSLIDKILSTFSFTR